MHAAPAGYSLTSITPSNAMVKPLGQPVVAISRPAVVECESPTEASYDGKVRRASGAADAAVRRFIVVYPTAHALNAEGGGCCRMSYHQCVPFVIVCRYRMCSRGLCVCGGELNYCCHLCFAGGSPPLRQNVIRLRDMHAAQSGGASALSSLPQSPLVQWGSVCALPTRAVDAISGDRNAKPHGL